MRGNTGRRGGQLGNKNASKNATNLNNGSGSTYAAARTDHAAGQRAGLSAVGHAEKLNKFWNPSKRAAAFDMAVAKKKDAYDSRPAKHYGPSTPRSVPYSAAYVHRVATKRLRSK
jgi:hypothetical protein